MPASVGETYTITAGMGEGYGAIASGTQFTVAEIVPASEPGAGDDTEDCAVLEFEDNGVTRRIAVAISQFDSLFGG